MTSVTFPSLGRFGVIKDKPAQELPVNSRTSPGMAWSDALNMRFRNGAIERFLGEKRVFDPPVVTPYYLQQYNQGGSRWWVHAGLNAIYADNGTTRLNVTPTSAPTGAIDDRYTGGTLNGVNVINNGKDAPWYWGGSGVFLPLTAWPAATRAASIRPYKNVLVALDVTKNVGTTNDRFPHMVKWSDVAAPGSVPGSWDQNDKTKLAGEIDLAEEPSLMVDQLQLADANIIYKENAMFSMIATGGLDPFRFQRLPGSVGALARGCVANTDVGHVVLAAGDVVLHSGQGPQSIINNVMRQWLFRTIDSTNRKRSFVTTNPVAKEVWICFPELGKASCSLAAIWNWVENTWAIRQLNNATYGTTGQIDYSAFSTWAAQTDAWQDAASAWDEDQYSPAQARLLTCSTTPAINAMDITATFNGSVYTSYVERTGISMDAPSMVKLIRSIVPRVDAAKGTRIQFEVGSQMDIEAPVTWSPAATHTVGGGFKVDTFSNGARFLALRISSLDNQPWRIDSCDIDIVSQGRY